MSKLKAVILAAGQGTRMKSKLPKVIHKIMDKTMVEYVIDAAFKATATEVCVVVGHGADLVQKEIESNCKHQDKIQYCLQKEQLGTGHAVLQAKDFIGQEGEVLILFGDTPLITHETLTKLVDYHRKEQNTVTVLSTRVDNPTGYGRIIRDAEGRFVKSVEHKDATDTEQAIQEINSGMFIFDCKRLYDALGELKNDNAQGEYYLPDVLPILRNQGYLVDALRLELSDEILGVNARTQLIEAQEILQKRINHYWLEEGVTIIAPAQTFIGIDVLLDNDVTIYPNTFIYGNTRIGEGSTIGQNSRIVNSQIGKEVHVEQSVVLDSSIGSHTTVGPFANVRPNCKLGEHVKIGDFVELKNAEIGDYTKASHLTYIADAKVGTRVNFGCGTVVVNYDSKHKHVTEIGDHAFIGCNTNLVAPIRVEPHGFTAAGSTIVEDVPSYALGIARAKQINKENWVKRKFQE